MSQALTFTNPTAGGLVRIGVLPVTVALSAEDYATASGGVTVDFSTVVASCGYQPPSFNDCFGAILLGTTGYRAIATKTSTSWQFTIKIYSAGATEFSDGSGTLTLTFKVLLLFANKRGF